MTIFVQPQRNSWKSSFRPDWQNFENFKLGPRAQFLANRPNSFFVDHIDTRSLGGIHQWASRGTAGRELKCGHIVPPPALNKLDQRPLYIGLTNCRVKFTSFYLTFSVFYATLVSLWVTITSNVLGILNGWFKETFSKGPFFGRLHCNKQELAQICTLLKMS